MTNSVTYCKVWCLITMLFLWVLSSVTATSFAAEPFPAPPQSYVDTTWNPPTGGTMRPAHTSAEFTTALTAAQPGDIIVLDAGTVYSGNFELPAKTNPSQKWIYIESSALLLLSNQGVRVTPSDAVNMPVISTPNATAAITLDPGTDHWRLVGLEIMSDSTQGGDPGANPPSNNWSYYLIQSDEGGPGSNLVNNITYDRLYVHGSDTQDVIHAVDLDGINMAVIDSYISDVHMQGADAQGVLALSLSPGPYKIVNNFISASTENIMFSPMDGLGNSNNPYLPSDIEIRGNWLYKPPAWDTCGVHGTVAAGGTLPDGSTCPAGVNNQWVVKDNLEFKIGQRAIITGNVLENNWVSGQVGYSLVLTARVSDASNLWISDILFQNNVIKNTDRGINTLEQSDQQGYTWFGYNKRVWIDNNLILLSKNLDNAHFGATLDGGDFVTGYGDTYGLTDYIFQHNTIAMIDGSPVDQSFYFTRRPDETCPTLSPSDTHNIWILDNAMTNYPDGDCGYTSVYGGDALSGVLLPSGTYFYGYMGDASSDFPARFFGNVIFLPSGQPTNWPADNDATGTAFTYVNPGIDNFQLLTPDWTDTTDGAISGINWSDIQTAINTSGTPVPSFTFNPSSPGVNDAVQFTDTSLGNPTGWSWNFGDTGTSNLENPTHTYTTAGTYPVTLTVSNANGQSQATQNVTVSGSSGGGDSTSFTYAPSSPTINQMVQFTDTSTNHPTSWSWNFGDSGSSSNTSTQQNPTHTYATTGSYTVTLTVGTGSLNGGGQDSQMLTVSSGSGGGSGGGSSSGGGGLDGFSLLMLLGFLGYARWRLKPVLS